MSSPRQRAGGADPLAGRNERRLQCGDFRADVGADPRMQRGAQPVLLGCRLAQDTDRRREQEHRQHARHGDVRGTNS